MSYDSWKTRAPDDDLPPDEWDLLLERIGDPEPLSVEETALRRAMIRSAVEERTCPNCRSIDRVHATRKERQITGFLCPRCGLNWGIS